MDQEQRMTHPTYSYHARQKDLENNESEFALIHHVYKEDNVVKEGQTIVRLSDISSVSAGYMAERHAGKGGETFLTLKSGEAIIIDLGSASHLYRRLAGTEKKEEVTIDDGSSE